VSAASTSKEPHNIQDSNSNPTATTTPVIKQSDSPTFDGQASPCSPDQTDVSVLRVSYADILLRQWY
jgi:hypothetical protein